MLSCILWISLFSYVSDCCERESSGHFESHVDRHHLPRSLVTANGPTDWNEALEIISMGSPEQVVYSLFIFLEILTF